MANLKETNTQEHRANYLDALLLLFSYLPTELHYTADSGRWSRAVMWLRDRYEDRYPHLFDDLSFSVQPGLYPYSKQVGEFLTLIQFGELVEVRNPGYALLHVMSEAQPKVRHRIQEQIGPELPVLAKRMAEELLADQRATIVVDQP